MNARVRVLDCQGQTTHPTSLSVLPTTDATPRRLTTVKSVSEGDSISDQHLRSCSREKAHKGDYTGAIDLLTQLIERHPTSAADYSNRGLIYYQSGQLEAAIADYNTAVQLNPQLDSAYNNRANYYASVGKLAEALADYETTLDLNPVNIRAWINQGITFRQLGLYELAIENFDFVLELGELEGHSYAQRGRTHHIRGDWNYGITDYRRALNQLGTSGADGRLRLQVESWLKQLLRN